MQGEYGARSLPDSWIRISCRSVCECNTLCNVYPVLINPSQTDPRARILLCLSLRRPRNSRQPTRCSVLYRPSQICESVFTTPCLASHLLLLAPPADTPRYSSHSSLPTSSLSSSKPWAAVKQLHPLEQVSPRKRQLTLWSPVSSSSS